MDTLQDWLYTLMHTPLRRGTRDANQLYIFCRAVGALYDRLIDQIKLARDAGMVLAAPDELLAEHGRDRDMPRLPGEEPEAYRARLAMAAETAEMAGTRAGLLAALAAMGLPSAYLQPYHERDPARWAEFLVWLRPEGDVIRLANIDREVRRLKEVGAKPAYGLAPAGAAVYVGGATKYGLSITIGPKEVP